MNLRKLILTFFGVGYLPYCPGTWASLVGVGLYFLLGSNLIVHCLVLVVLLMLGFAFAGQSEKLFGQKDSKYIVIDEICAMLLVLLAIPQKTIFLILGFLLFRLFDIIKIYPAKKIENFAGSWGIMLDDVIASIYSIILIYIVGLFI